MSDVTLVTAFFDLDRSNWSSPMFRRPNEDYFRAFSRLVSCDYPMVIYVDDRHLDALATLVDGSMGSNVKKVVPISEKWMQDNIWAWSRLQRESEIMESGYYKQLIPQRIALGYPENVNPRYTILTHSKIDFLCHAADSKYTDNNILLWTDFGYLSDKAVGGGFIPRKNLIGKNLIADKVNLCSLNNPIVEQDFDPIYTLRNAPEKLTAGVFGGKQDTLRKFQSVSHGCLLKMQEMGIADDEQALWLACIKAMPSLFAIHMFPGWHYGLKYFTED